MSKNLLKTKTCRYMGRIARQNIQHPVTFEFDT